MKELFDTLSDQCSRLTTPLYSTSFSLGIYYLDRDLRTSIYAIYGFVRLADEIFDSFHAYNKTALLAELKRASFDAISAGISINPILNSFQHVVNTFQIDHTLIDQFMYSMEMDLSPTVYSAEKYDKYIMRSAQAVGLMCLYVFTNNDKTVYNKLKNPAMKLGAAFQKVNFLRDVGADYHILNRSYFPEVDIVKFEELDKKIIEDDIESDFVDALQGIRQLPKSCRLGVFLAYSYYHKLFLKIKGIGANKMLVQRIRISNPYKCWLMIVSLIRYNLNLF